MLRLAGVRTQSPALVTYLCLASVLDSTTVFETVRRGSTPWRGTLRDVSLEGRVLSKTQVSQLGTHASLQFSECAGTHATLRRS